MAIHKPDVPVVDGEQETATKAGVPVIVVVVQVGVAAVGLVVV